MAKNTFAIIGILAVLLLGIGMISAVDYVQDVTLKVVGDGVTGNRLTGVNDSSNIFTVNFTNNNASLGAVYVNWSVGTETDMNLADSIIVSVGESNISGNFDLTMPYKASSYVRLTAHIYDNSNRSIKYGTKYVNVYYNNTDYVTSTDIPGCTDSTANNYDSTATTDDGSCTYDTTPIPGCTDSTANNYDSSATVDDGSCTYDPTPSTSTTFCELETYTDQGDLKISDFDINDPEIQDLLLQCMKSTKVFAKTFFPEAVTSDFLTLHDKTFAVLDNQDIRKKAIAARSQFGWHIEEKVLFSVYKDILGK